MKLDVDYVSNIDLLNLVNRTENIKDYVKENIAPKAKSKVLIIAGDICEYLDYTAEFLYESAKYYDKVLFVAGNLEYYLHNHNKMLFEDIASKYEYNSLNKIKELDGTFENNPNIAFLDRNASNKGIVDIDGFKVAGDTLWESPKGFTEWIDYTYKFDSRFIVTAENYIKTIKKLNEDSLSWYNNLSYCDLLITHSIPFKGYEKRNGIEEFKANYWIYGESGKSVSFIQNDTLFVTNPWNKENIKRLTLTK